MSSARSSAQGARSPTAGAPRTSSRKRSKNCAALVATPGRLKDFIDDGSVDLSKVRFLCFDEADRMLDMGFIDAVRAIAGTCTLPNKLVCMFSATWPPDVRKVADDFLSADHVRVVVGAKRLEASGPEANRRVAQTVVVCEQRARDGKLIELLRKRYPQGAVVPTTHGLGSSSSGCTRKNAPASNPTSIGKGWRCVAIHGDMSQAARTKAFDDFRGGKVPLLVATDVAARGLDIPDVELVVNYSFPLTIEDYVHRVGRTGRAGKSGAAHTFFHGDGHEKASPARLQIDVATRRGRGACLTELLKFGSTVKKKEDKNYGAFGPRADLAGKKATKIVAPTKEEGKRRNLVSSDSRLIPEKAIHNTAPGPDADKIRNQDNTAPSDGPAPASRRARRRRAGPMRLARAAGVVTFLICEREDCQGHVVDDRIDSEEDHRLREVDGGIKVAHQRREHRDDRCDEHAPASARASPDRRHRAGRRSTGAAGKRSTGTWRLPRASIRSVQDRPQTKVIAPNARPCKFFPLFVARDEILG